MTAYLGGSVLDATGDRFVGDAALLVRGERIVEVGREGVVAIPKGADVVRLDGRFVVPGLINSHVHLATLANPREARAYLRRELYSGVTAVRDMAGDARLLGELKREAAFDEIVAPDVYYAALMAGPSFFADPRSHDASRGIEPGAAPWMRAITAATDVPLAVAEARGTGATGIKLYADLPAASVRAVVAEAHRQHLLVWAHAAVFPASPAEVGAAGVDVMSHASFLAYQGLDPMPQSYAAMKQVDLSTRHLTPAIETVLETMRDRGVVLDATLDVEFHIANPKWPPALAVEITRAAYRHGVAISAGTDDDADWTDPDSDLLVEISRLVQDVGMSPADALRSATVVGARTIGEQNSMGALEPGRLADFVVLAGDPLRRISELRSVVEVVKHGIRHPRADYHPVTGDSMRKSAPE
ncbi:MAG TPA: amidohydrolase family protein [Caldimonas sp.]|nr:amidohydrolase family protein [Caldimonas sp.]